MVVHPWLTQLQTAPHIAILRLKPSAQSVDWGYRLGALALNLGVQHLELTWADPHLTLGLLERFRQDFPHHTIGLGTILTAHQYHQGIEAGSQFCFSPITCPTLLALAHDRGVPLIPGAATPTEIFMAHQAGAIAVKVFPIKTLGLAQYIRCLQDPLGSIPLIPTGGVTLDNAPDLLAAGSLAVGISGGLFVWNPDGSPDFATTQTRIQTLLTQGRSIPIPG